MRTLKEISEDINQASNKLSLLENEHKQAEREEREKRQDAERARRMALRARLENENGMSNHPKAELLWNKACDNANGSDIEVQWWYEDLLELIK
jgi:hypothetical protein